MIIAVVYVAAAALTLASLGLGFYALRSRDEDASRALAGRAALSAVAGLAAAAALVLLFT